MMRKLILTTGAVFAALSLTLLPASLPAVTPAPPKINSPSYLLLDFNSDKYIVSENIDVRLEPASLTKMMTVYVVSEELKAGNISLDDSVLVSEKAWRMQGSRMFIEVDKEVRLEDLIKGVVIQSGNDASVALAEHVSGSEDVFANVMNQTARRLGMTGTNYMNSTGLPGKEHYTTARDLATLAKAIIRDHPEIYAWHSIREFTYNGIKQHNRNSMLWRDDSIDGIKTGHTETAGYCLVGSAKRGDMRLISVVMGTDGNKARTTATQTLMNYGFRYYETHKLYDAGQMITSNRIWKGSVENLDFGISEALFVTIPRGMYKELNAVIEIDKNIVAPVEMGESHGLLKITLDNEKVVDKPLVALQAVDEGSFLNRIKDEIQLLFE